MEDIEDKLFKDLCGNTSALIGARRRISGDSYLHSFQFRHEKRDFDMHFGWDYAEDAISHGEIFSVHNFHSLSYPEGHAFKYGTTWACNYCGKAQLDKPWWEIKVYKDGNQWVCVGKDFTNIQDSDGYAFGSTREEALNNYGRNHLS